MSKRKNIKNKGTAMIISLPRGGILIIELHEQELTVESREGRLWVTQTGDSKDYVLDQSEKCLLLGSGEIFIEALCHARLAIFAKTGFAMNVNDRSVLREGACLL